MSKRLFILLTFFVVLGLVVPNVVFGDVLEVRVAAGEDDSEEDVATGVIDLTSSDLEITEEGEPALNQLVGMRFNNIDIPQGAIITNAYVQFQVDEIDVPSDNRPGTKFLRGEAVDNAAAFSDAAFDISSRPTTSAEASWDWPEWLTEDEEGPDQQTSDIAAVIQELVDRPGWASGNSLALIITGSGENCAEAFEGEADAAPLLHVEFTSAQDQDPEAANSPSPADGAIDVENMPVLSWAAGETAFQHDVYFGTDADLVAAGDASVLQGSLADASFAPAEALDQGITYYWKVDVSTGSSRASAFHPGTVWSFRVVDRYTDNWAATVTGDSPAYLDTFVADGLYDIGALSGDITYEFVVKSNPDETEASMALIGRRQFGDTQAGIKYEQWNNTGTYGATLFGVVDLDFGVPTAPGEYTHLTFVSSEDAATTRLYVNGVQEGSVDRAITLSGLVGIGYGAQGEDMSGAFDNFDGTIFGVAIYDSALPDDVIAKHSDSYFTPIAITDPDLLIHYDFESGEGLTAIDRSGHGNHGLLMGTPEWVTGIFGGALEILSADADYVETSAPLNIVTNTVTVAGWVKHDESQVAWSGILTHRGTSPGCLGLQHDGNVLTYMWGADQYWSFASGLEIPNGEWYFAALAISPDQGKLYLNGIEQTATNVAEHVPTNLDGLISVGRDIGFGADRIMSGLIDEVRLYNKTLTDVEILKLMGAVSDVTAPGDVVQGVPNDGDWPGAETPDLATDDNTGTKYLHFKGETEPTGFQIAPASGASVVTGLTFTTANDAPERDPVAYELYGSNDSIDGPYTLIASGDIVDFAQETALPRFTMNATPIMFDNDVAYKYYQLMFPAVRDPGSANSMQIAEVELLGVPAPVAHWTFDEGAGTVAADSSGNGNDGTLVGDPQWVAGVVGGALEFNGDDYVDCGNGPSLEIRDAITISFWFNVVAFENEWEAMLSKGDSAYRVSRGDGTGDATHFGLSGTDAGGGNGWFNGNSIITGGDWHHFAGTYDGAGGKIYIDGALDATTEATGQINIETENFWIGNNSQNTNRFFHGMIDDVRLYNQALSPLHVSAIAKSADEPVAASLISAVVRSNGVSGDRDPVGAYDGGSAPLATEPGGLMDGNLVYSDRTYPWAGVPAEYVGSEYIRTYNSDKNGGTIDVTYEVTISRPAIVWITVDDRIPAEWDAGGAIASPQDAVDYVTAAFAAPGTFADTGIDMYVHENDTTDRSMSVYAAELDAGTYVFGSMDSGKNFYSIGAVE